MIAKIKEAIKGLERGEIKKIREIQDQSPKCLVPVIGRTSTREQRMWREKTWLGNSRRNFPQRIGVCILKQFIEFL